MDAPPTTGPKVLLGRVFGSWQFWVLSASAIFAFNVGRAVLTPLPEPLPVLGVLPEFSFTNQWGETYGSEQLAGRAWVANFIFTRCKTVCPPFTAKMAQIQHRGRNLGDAFRLVSFSVDPEYDTPEVLREYAARYKASRLRWAFLTGDLGQIRHTVVDGLKIAMGGHAPEGNAEGIFHGSHFVLVDPVGQIRGYYDSNDADAVERLLTDAGWLLNLGR